MLFTFTEHFFFYHVGEQKGAYSPALCDQSFEHTPKSVNFANISYVANLEIVENNIWYTKQNQNLLF